MIGSAVPGQQHLGAERRHLAQRVRPLARIALHLLRIARVRRRPDEQVAGAQHAAIRHPHPGVIVGLAARVVQLERRRRRPRASSCVRVGLVGLAKRRSATRPAICELARVDAARCSRAVSR